MPRFDDSDEEGDNRDTVMVGKNADSKLFENVEEMLKMQDDGNELEFEEAKSALEIQMLTKSSSEMKPRMSRRQS